MFAASSFENLEHGKLLYLAPSNSRYLLENQRAREVEANVVVFEPLRFLQPSLVGDGGAGKV